MGVEKFEIVLDSLIWYSGQTIQGKLLVDTDKPIKMRGIRLNYTGKGLVRWSEGSGKNKRTYTNKETYLDLQQLICGSYEEESELAKGQYVFIFNCKLPAESPCSFEGDWGRVKYSIKATMDLPWKIDPVVKQRLTVVSIMDLNHHPVAAAPVAAQNSKTFWGSSGSLFVSFSLPVRGFVAGQMIPIQVFMSNESEVEVKRISAELNQNVMYHATSKSRPGKTLICGGEIPVKPGVGKTEYSLLVKVPALPPSYLAFCNIIDVRYHLSIIAEVSGLHTNLETPTEILIGNVPLVAYQRSATNHREVLPEPLDPENPSHSQSSSYRPPPYNVVTPASTTYGDLPPPSYEQCVGPATSEREKPSDDSDSDSEVQRFAPLYPVFQFDTIKE